MAASDPRPLDIIALGEAMVEFNQTSPNEPSYRQGYGGDTSNMAIAAARQGARVGYLSAVGNDAFGAQLIALWQAEQVATDSVVVDDTAPTGVYFVTHGASGHEFSYLRAGSAASRMTPDTMPIEHVGRARWLHLSGISQAISQTACDTAFAAIAAARAAGTRVAYDTNLRLKLWPIERARAIIHATVPLCDVLLPSLDDAKALTGLADPDAVVDYYLELGAPIVVLKQGSDGVMVGSADTRFTVAAHRVDSVDATGAGDTFDGALLAELVAGRDMASAVRYANAAAALSTTGYGAVAPMPRRAQVEALLGTLAA